MAKDVMRNKKYPPVNIWNNIERVWVNRVDVVYEGQTIVGIHHSDWDDAIKEIDILCRKLQLYKKDLEAIYGIKNTKTKSMIFSYIYVLKCHDTNLFKIGRSINPGFREKTLLSQSPNISTVFVSPQTLKTKEKELHSILKNKRVRGEWFDLTKEDIFLIKSYDYAT